MNVIDETPFLVIVSGLPCTGKTTISNVHSEKLSLPIMSKDLIKESLFDSLGWEDRDWSKKLGKASYPILHAIIESQLKAKKSFIVESNFSSEIDTTDFSTLNLDVVHEFCSDV